MPGFLIRLFVTALALGIASAIVPGIEIRGFWALLGAAFLLGLVNAIIRPVLVILTFPITLLTLGLFLWVINAAMLGLVAAMMENFTISGFFPGTAGGIGGQSGELDGILVCGAGGAHRGLYGHQPLRHRGRRLQGRLGGSADGVVNRSLQPPRARPVRRSRRPARFARPACAG